MSYPVEQNGNMYNRHLMHMLMLTTVVSLHALKYLNHTRHLPSLYPGSINVTELYLTGCHKFPKGLQKHRILKIQYGKQNKDECLKCRPKISQ